MTDEETPSRRVLIVQWATIAVVAALVLYTAGTSFAEQRQDRFAACDQEHGEDNWVFVEKDVPWYEDIALGPGPGPLECVSMDSPRADNCVLTDVIADYNTRCSEL